MDEGVPNRETHQDVGVAPDDQDQNASRRAPFKYACSRCGRPKPWPASKCVGCPKKPSVLRADDSGAAGGFAATATLPEPPYEQLAERARVVQRLGGAYSLRPIPNPAGTAANVAAAGSPTEAAAAPEQVAAVGEDTPSGCAVNGWRADEQEAAEEDEAQALAGPRAQAPDESATWSDDEDEDEDEADGGGGDDGGGEADKALCEKVLTGTGANRGRSSSRRLPKQMYPVEKALECVSIEGAGRAYLVKWEGYPPSAAEWVLEEHVTQEVIDDFHQNGRSGLMLGSNDDGLLEDETDYLEPTAQQKRTLDMIQCGTFKYKQKGTPHGGYLRRTKGVLMAVLSCNLIVGFTECFGSESTSQVVFFLLRLFTAAPDLLDRLEVLAYDDMCHLRKYLELRRASNPLYEKMLQKIMCVDKTHIWNHQLTESGKPGCQPKHGQTLNYCGKHCNPLVEPAKSALEKENTQSSEQTFKWFGKMKSVMRPMTRGRFNFTVLRVAERHNQRTVWQHQLEVERRRVAGIQKAGRARKP